MPQSGPGRILARRWEKMNCSDASADQGQILAEIGVPYYERSEPLSICRMDSPEIMYQRELGEEQN